MFFPSVGNHVDAWTFGAADPNSGTASVHELVKGLGSLYKRGWKPARSILIAAWDAEEYGLVGSTEMGEDYAEWIQEHVISYHNVDVSVSGSFLEVQASPSLKKLLQESGESIQDPEKNGTLTTNDRMNKIRPLGSGSDYTVFLQHLGIASTNFGYSRSIDKKDEDPVYHYHSNYDSFHWMENFGDPTFERHVTISKLLGVVLLRSVSSGFLEINVQDYSEEIGQYLANVEKVLVKKSNADKDILNGLKHSVKRLEKVSKSLGARQMEIQKGIDSFFGNHSTSIDEISSITSRPDFQTFIQLLKEMRMINQKLIKYESHFIDDKGLAGREWYRHLVVAPGRWLGEFPILVRCGLSIQTLLLSLTYSMIGCFV